MVKINKNLILLILIAFISISCNGEEYEKYLTDQQLLEVARIKLNNFAVHVAIDKSEYINGVDSRIIFGVIPGEFLLGKRVKQERIPHYFCA